MQTKRHLPLKVRSLLLPNRIVVPPMASQTAEEDGSATEATLAHYTRLASLGAGLVFVEYSFIHLSGRSETHQLGAATEAHFQGLASIAAAIKANGAKVGLQLVHAGGKTSQELTGGVLQAPSAFPVPVKDREMPMPQEMGETECALWRDAFATAAARAAGAGFDVIELHAAHGYGLNQWLSPVTNLRTDALGGSLTGRFRFVGACVDAVRAAAPEVVLAVRMPGRDFTTDGQDIAEGIELARMFVGRGVDIIDVSSGVRGWRRPHERVGEGYLLEEARAIQAVVPVPVIAVGGFATPEGIEAALHDVALVAVGRASLQGTRWA